MRLIKMSGIALAVLAGCAHESKDTKEAATPPAPISSQPQTNAVSVATPPAPAPAPAPAPMAVTVVDQSGTWVAAGSDDESIESLRYHHRHHHQSGVGSFVVLSLETLEVDEGQRVQIEKIRSSLWTSMQPARDAERNLVKALADGVQAGNVDTTRIDAAVMNVSSASGAANAGAVDALNQLHMTLTPIQRQVLADKVVAHWTIWRKVNHDEAEMSREKGTELTMLTDELQLTPAQVEKIAFKTSKPMKMEKFDAADAEAHVQAFADAFASDPFDAGMMTKSGMANGHIAAHGARRMVRFYASVTPVLTPEQRTLLANDLREHGNHQHANAMN
jgi:Spy/CpxP family protein refolding chaperone